MSEELKLKLWKRYTSFIIELRYEVKQIINFSKRERL